MSFKANLDSYLNVTLYLGSKQEISGYNWYFDTQKELQVQPSPLPSPWRQHKGVSINKVVCEQSLTS